MVGANAGTGEWQGMGGGATPQEDVGVGVRTGAGDCEGVGMRAGGTGDCEDVGVVGGAGD